MIVDVSIRVGTWWFKNGHLFRLGTASNRKGDVRWEQWTCVMCRGHPHTVRTQESARASLR